MSANPFSNPDEPFLPRQQAFIAEYLIDAKPEAAAVRAGYEPDSAAGSAGNLLRNPRIIDAIKRGQAQRLARVNMQADTVIVELAALALSRIDHYVVDDDGNVQLTAGAPENAMAAIQSVKRKKTVREAKNGELIITYDVEIKLWDKPGALKLMGKHAGVAACFDKLVVTGPHGGPIEMITEVRRVLVRMSEDDQREDEVVH
jgi:phage terminase small subunit